MKILIADKFETSGIDALKAGGLEVVSDPGLSGEALVDAIRDSGCKALVVRSTKVTEEMLSAADALGLIVRAGAGVNTIDVAAASRRSIAVANCPGKNAVAVAELTFALILALDRRIVHNTVDLYAGSWNKKEYGVARGLKSRTLGLIGMGKIGQAVARRAIGFEMNVIAWSRSLTYEQAAEWGVSRCATPEEVASGCDILSLHLAATPETKHIIGDGVLSRLKSGSYLINTARAEVLDSDALSKAIADRHLRVAMDVWPGEPSGAKGEFRPEILKTAFSSSDSPNGGILGTDPVIYGTHHIGASTDQAQDAIARETVRILLEYACSGRVLNCVNVRKASETTWCLTVRHLNRPGVLSHVLNKISHAGINVEEMENSIMKGSEAACAHIHIDAEPAIDVLAEIRSGSENILGVSVSGGSTR